MLINVEPDDLDLDNNFTHIRLSVTVATAACLIAALVLGFNAWFGSASDNDAATVDEIGQPEQACVTRCGGPLPRRVLLGDPYEESAVQHDRFRRRPAEVRRRPAL